jgi:hypothetical protein
MSMERFSEQYEQYLKAVASVEIEVVQLGEMAEVPRALVTMCLCVLND